MTCCAQHLGRFIEGQGHSMTLQQNRVRTITSLFPILKLFHRNDHHIEVPCHKQHLGHYLKGQGHITLLFEVGFHNYLTEMITI